MNRGSRIRQFVPPYVVAVLTILAGIGSLGVFMSFLSGMRVRWIRLGLDPAAALAWDALLCLIFFVQHSGMVRRPFRSWLERWIPSYLHGALYTWASALALVLLCVLWQPADAAPVVLDGPIRQALLGLALLGIAGFVWAFVSLGSFDAFGAGALLARFRKQLD